QNTCEDLLKVFERAGLELYGEIDKKIKNLNNNEVKTYFEKLDQEQKTLASYNGKHDISKAIKDILAKNSNYKSTM
ncbi:MAG: hypothetical protein ACK4NX_02670, partial [Candidatus Paceibacteria bacterium]